MTNVMSRHTSRQRILDYLGQHKGASAAEISLAMRVTAANIRHHLEIMAQDGRVRILGNRPETGRGRPVKIYGLGEADREDNLAGLVNVLLFQAFTNLDELEKKKMIEQIAEQLTPHDTHIDGKIAIRLTETVSILSRHGYSARWEAHAAAPRIIFEHCPYAAVIENHPELCKVDQILLNRHLGGSVEQTAKLEKNTRGTSFCRFVLLSFNQ